MSEDQYKNGKVDDRRRYDRHVASFGIDVRSPEGDLIEHVELRDISEAGLSFTTQHVEIYRIKQNLCVCVPQYDHGKESLVQAKATVVTRQQSGAQGGEAWVGVEIDEFIDIDSCYAG